MLRAAPSDDLAPRRVRRAGLVHLIVRRRAVLSRQGRAGGRVRCKPGFERRYRFFLGGRRRRVFRRGGPPRRRRPHGRPRRLGARAGPLVHAAAAAVAKARPRPFWHKVPGRRRLVAVGRVAVEQVVLGRRRPLVRRGKGLAHAPYFLGLQVRRVDLVHRLGRDQSRGARHGPPAALLPQQLQRTVLVTHIALGLLRDRLRRRRPGTRRLLRQEDLARARAARPRSSSCHALRRVDDGQLAPGRRRRAVSRSRRRRKIIR